MCAQSISSVLEDVYPNWLLFGPFPQVMVPDNYLSSDAEDSPQIGVDERLIFQCGGYSRPLCLSSV